MTEINPENITVIFGTVSKLSTINRWKSLKKYKRKIEAGDADEIGSVHLRPSLMAKGTRAVLSHLILASGKDSRGKRTSHVSNHDRGLLSPIMASSLQQCMIE
jgi:hypothetical protein